MKSIFCIFIIYTSQFLDYENILSVVILLHCLVGQCEMQQLKQWALIIKMPGIEKCE